MLNTPAEVLCITGKFALKSRAVCSHRPAYTAIDVAWTNPSPEVIAVHQEMGFGDKAPSPEEFVKRVSTDVRREMDEEELS